MSMFLTRFPLNLSKWETRAMLSDPHKMHAAVAACFPPQRGDSDAESIGRVLWRVDRLSEGGSVLFITSPGKPSLVGLDKQIGWPDLDRQWETRSYDRFLASLKEGQRWAFRLVANPVVSRSKIKNDRGESKRIGHLTELQQAAWLIGKEAYRGLETPVPELFQKAESSRAERNGFSIAIDGKLGIPQLVVSDSRKISFAGGGKRRISLVTARYDGVLEVTDGDLLRRALVNGIGHAKGFGCGMMTLAPARQS